MGIQRILVICCYFGELPPYYSAWLFSCAWNPTIDFLIVTDQEVENLPDNVFLHRSTLEDVRDRAEAVLGFAPRLEDAYKLCDYKVLYGLMFQERCAGYDFWGHCDMDMVFGDLRSFLTEDVLAENDRIYPYGHLALYRNTEEVAWRFKDAGSPYSCREVFGSDEVFFFDERCYLRICRANGYPCYDRIEMADIRTRHKRFCVHKALGNYRHQLFLWRKGHVIRIYAEDDDLRGMHLKEDEFPYIHFKRRREMKEHIRQNCPADYEDFMKAVKGQYGFAISEAGFTFLQQEPDYSTIQTLNPFPGRPQEMMEDIRYELMAKRKHARKKIDRLLQKTHRI